MSDEYMNKKVRPILEQIVDALLDSTPDDPILFIYTWLVNYKNIEHLKQRIELESIIAKKKKIKNKNNLNKRNKNYEESFVKQEISSEEQSENSSSEN